MTVTAPQRQEGDSRRPRREGLSVGAGREYRPDVEGLRAVAVTLVVLFGVGVPRLAGGFVGVDVFFVVSGYLVTWQLLGRARATGRTSLLAFYARRAQRVLPMVAFVTVTTLLATWWVTSALEARNLTGDALWVGLFALNVHLAAAGVSSSTGANPSALQHLWALAIGAQFTLVWPVVITVASLVWRRRRTATSGTRRGAAAVEPSRLSLSLVVGLVAAVSFGYGVYQTHVAQSQAYYLTASRVWELAVGALVAVHAGSLARLGSVLRELLIVLGLGLVIGAAFLFGESTAFPGLAALAPVLGTAVVLAAGVGSSTRIERWVLGQPPLQGLGKVSLGFYLWHWPLLVLAPAYFNTEQLSVGQRIEVVLSALWIATITYFGIENPIRVRDALRRVPWKALVAGLACLAISAATSFAMSAIIPDPRGSGRPAQALTDLARLPDAVTAGNNLKSLPSNVTPTVVAARRDRPVPTTGDGRSCMVDLLGTGLSDDPRASCAYGKIDGTPTVVLTGDAHAYQWLPAMEAIALDKGWRLLNLTKADCPLYDVQLVDDLLKRDYKECYSWRNAVLQRLKQEHPALIVTSAFTGPVNRDPTYTTRWITGMKSTIKKLKASAAKVVVVEDTPDPVRDIPACLARHLDNASRCSVPRRTALSDPGRRTAGASAAAAGGAVLIDPVPWFCSASACPAVIGDNIVYRDDATLTATYARTLKPLIASALPKL
jgi:peptidoglycan/LPS O-acetylase OafA/YrhL